MKKITLIAQALVLILLLQGCASIFSTSSYPINIQSTPNKANITITDRNGVEVFLGQTPAIANLKSSQGFMKKAIYNIRISKKGYTTKTYSISSSLDGWYWGNLLFGGLVGMLIVDPATGAMFRLKDNSVDSVLSAETANLNSSEKHSQELRIYDITEIPNSWKENLVRISN